MQLHTLAPATDLKKKIKIGRGGKRGKTSGRGMKGQNARAGHKKRPEMRDIIKKLPKLRGYRFNSYQDKPTVVTFEFIESAFQIGETVNPTTLASKGIHSMQKHTLKLVKILNKGTLTKKLNFEGCLASVAAQKVITDTGGTIVLLEKQIQVRVKKPKKV